MQGLWYGDRRDRVKWGALVHLANTKGIRGIVQVAYFRHGTDLKLQTEQGEVELPVQVWNHFSNLRHIERLGDATGLKIIVLDQLFDPGNRSDYINMIGLHLEEINKEIKSRKIIFLDPDTGIEPENAKPEHVTEHDLREIWNRIRNGDLLAVYQHADHTKKWLDERKQKMSNTCDGLYINTILGENIASDVAIFWCCKKKALRTCACQCGNVPQIGYFCPGHDAKLKSIFLKISRGEGNKKELDESRLRMYEIWEKEKSKPLREIAKEVLGE